MIIRYHPHKHGSTTIQTSTSHGALIVEDDPYWFPWNSGTCGSLYATIKTAPEYVLDFELLFFAKTRDSINIPNFQEVANQSDPVVS